MPQALIALISPYAPDSSKLRKIEVTGDCHWLPITHPHINILLSTFNEGLIR